MASSECLPSSNLGHVTLYSVMQYWFVVLGLLELVEGLAVDNLSIPIYPSIIILCDRSAKHTVGLISDFTSPSL